jgi:hypothetical protein
MIPAKSSNSFEKSQKNIEFLDFAVRATIFRSVFDSAICESSIVSQFLCFCEALHAVLDPIDFERANGLHSFTARVFQARGGGVPAAADKGRCSASGRIGIESDSLCWAGM